MIKKIIVFVVIALLFIAGFYLFLNKEQQTSISDLEIIKQNHPELSKYIDDAVKWREKLKEDENNIEMYNTLGLAWKSLADWGRNSKLENYQDYYAEALKVYEAGIEKTLRKNTLLMTNAGNMAKYLEDYELAEDYYKEAITVSPGEVTYYALLAELYEYEMKKTKEEVAAVYDEGMKRVLDVGFLEKRKDAYLNRTK
ncbi:hypothetical protein KKC83_01510 [Patescibacteria group bacterium]|nr:hypothetical protein [Candidatus Falkowbacteria bacterium]MBU3906058.1 hypothetical protein [Patescibacteria group bacterium]MBU4015087.1 hypothetical protein [Patescibacteria group bacterium]MBU4026203.1 hypothetical protein [Patescibacteria group bacterium]MBU4073707.1 hypothetical protein [Patescibacteria group bacterium]